jgi:MYXO-CTERM domain-containing protein
MFAPSALEGLSPMAFVALLPEAGFFGSNEVLEVLRVHIPVPASFPYDEIEFYNNPWSYPEYYDLIEGFDADAAIADLMDAEVEPRQAAQEMLDRSAWLTRLRSSVSPTEMTLDPHFGFNPDLPRVANLGWLDVQRMCDGVIRDFRDAPQRLAYPYGQTLVIPSENALAAQGLTPFEYVQDQSGFAALFIEQMSTSGPPEVLVDQSDQALPGLTEDTLPGTQLPGTYGGGSLANDGGDTEANGGCGCSATGSAAGWLPLLGLLALGRRR